MVQPVVEPNAVSRGLGLLGDEWMLLLLREALLGASRYSDFAANLSISHAVLTNRLGRMTEAGLAVREPYQQKPLREAYVLTPRGRSVWPLLVATWSWERAWVPARAENTPDLVHHTCRKPMAPDLVCSDCLAPAGPTDLSTAWGPSGGWARTVPGSTTRRRAHAGGMDRASGSFFPDTMAVFGNRWSAAVVGAAFLGLRRFTDFESMLGIPPSLLAERLASLGRFGILEQVPGTERPDRSSYRLSDKGRAFFPVIALAIEWSEHSFPPPEGRSLVWTHRACGNDFHGTLVCDRCGDVLAGDQVDRGPS